MTAPRGGGAGWRDLKAYVDRPRSRREREPTTGCSAASSASTLNQAIDHPGTHRHARAAADHRGLRDHDESARAQHPGLLATPRSWPRSATATSERRLITRSRSCCVTCRSFTMGRRRVAVRDVQIGGQLIRAGGADHRRRQHRRPDPSSSPDSGCPRHSPPNAKAHVAFGYGIHQCLGQHLSRMELRYAIPALLRRFPSLRLAVPFDQLKFKEGYTVYGVAELPVEW